MRYKQDIEKVKERFDCFWGNEYAGRALVAVTAPKQPGVNISMFHNSDIQMYKEPERLKEYWENPHTIYQNNINRIENTYYAGEAFPVIFQNFGTSGHCNYIGAKPVYGNDTIWFDKGYSRLDEITGEISTPAYKRHIKLTEYLSNNADDKYFIGMPDNTGTIDAIAHVFGSAELLLEMYENPVEVIKVINNVNRIWRKTSEKFYKIAESVNKGGAHAWMYLLAPGRLQHMQCDLSVMISPVMYERFVIPELEYQMKWIDFPVYHFDGIEQERHLNHLLSLKKLMAIQWTEVAGQASPTKYIPVLKRMQQAGKRLIIMCSKNDIVTLLENLSSKGLYLNLSADSPDEADEIVRLVEKYSQ